MPFLLVLLLTLSLSAEGGKFPRDLTCFDHLVELRQDPTFLPLRRDLPFLRENWALDASGADLMREHRAVAQGEYANNKVAVIDTGLSLNGNPAAGPALVAVSPELDYDAHGTGVVGVVASQRYGVNPRLQVLPVPVRYREPSFNFFTGRAGGFDQISLQQKWREVLTDPAVSVINLSMAENVPEVEIYVKEALAMGKWVVYSAGNSGKVNDNTSAAMGGFNGQPGFFISGGLSYLGAPASFSHYGPGVKFYSPGSSVETLHGYYNPRLVGSPPNTAYDGTSFSAPHLSAVLATMRAIHPMLTPQDAEWILEQTAIKRGKAGEYLQVNPFHAVELLTRAKQIKNDGACRTPMGCYKAARKKIAEEVMRLSPIPPSTPDRDAWLAYYHELRRGYFLSNADRAFAEPLRELLIALGRESAAETVYYAARRDNKPLQALPPEGKALREEHARARAALAKAPKVTGPQKLADVPTLPENVDLFLDLAGKYFEMGGVDIDGVGRSLSEARRPFLVALVQKLLARRRPLATSAPFYYFRKIATTKDDKALLQKLMARTLSGWKVNGNVQVLEGLLPILAEMTEEQRLELLVDFETKRAAKGLTCLQDDGYLLTERNFDRLDSRLRVWQADLGGHDARIKVSQGPEGANGDWEGILDFGFAAARFRAGHHSPAQLAKGFASLLSHRREQKHIRFYGATMGNAVGYHLGQATYNREGSEAIASVLLQDDHLALMGTMFDIGSMVMLLLRNAGSEVRRDLIAALVKTEKDKSVQVQDRLSQTLYNHRGMPEVKAFIDELLAAKQSDPALQRMRLNFLKWTANGSGLVLTDYGRRYLEESETGEKRIFVELPFTQVINDLTLQREILAQLKEPSLLGPDPSNTVQWMLTGSQKDFGIVQSALAANLAAILKASPIVTTEEAEGLGAVFAASAGDNEEVIRRLIKQGETLLADRAYCDRPVDDKRAGYPPFRDQGTVKMLLELSTSVEGARQLAKKKALLQRMADIIVANEDKLFFSRRETVFPPLAEVLQARFPKIDVVIRQDYFPTWMIAVQSTDTKHLDAVLNHLKNPLLTPGSYARAQMEAVLMELLNLNPTLVPLVRSHSRATPEAGLAPILQRLGYTP